MDSTWNSSTKWESWKKIYDALWLNTRNVFGKQTYQRNEERSLDQRSRNHDYFRKYCCHPNKTNSSTWKILQVWTQQKTFPEVSVWEKVNELILTWIRKGVRNVIIQPKITCYKNVKKRRKRTKNEQKIRRIEDKRRNSMHN